MSKQPFRPNRPGAGSRAGRGAKNKRSANFVAPEGAGQAVNRFAEEKRRREMAEREEERIAEEVKVTSGRGLGRSVPGRQQEEAAPPPPPSDGSSPFGNYVAQDDPAPTNSSPFAIYAILVSLLFMAGGMGVVGVSFAGVAYYQMGDPLGIYTKQVVVKRAKGKRGAKDTGGDPENTYIDESVRQRKRARVAAVVHAKNECEAARAKPWFAKATIKLKPGHPRFHSIEINCPQNNVRTRATFSNKTATSQGALPSNEPCQVNFQGVQPAQTTLRAGQTKLCSFNPTKCSVVRQKPRPPIPECENQ